MTSDSAGILLLLAREGTPLPPELATFETQSGMKVFRLDSIYEAATKMLDPGRVRALFIDPTLLNAKVAAALPIFRQRTSLPFVLLPSTPSVSAPLLRQVAPLVTAWSESSPLLAQLILFQRENLAIDRREPLAAPPTAGNLVTSPLDSRYDDLDAGPLLSEQEIRALLGSPE